MNTNLPVDVSTTLDQDTNEKTSCIENMMITYEYQIVKFMKNDLVLDVNVSPKEDTVWLTLEQMAHLFDRDRSVIGKHIRNIYKELELDENSTRANFAQVQIEGVRRITRNISYYNLDVIISVGYRVKSLNGTIFRKWANNILKEYLIRGYIIDEKRTLITNENYINLINKVDSMDKRLSMVEKMNLEKEKVFYDGEMFDARAFISHLISLANISIILIDAYADIKALKFFKHKKKEVHLSIYRSSKSKLSDKDISDFNSQYGMCSSFINDKFHDRFLILDGSDVYHLGTSLNYVGKKIFAVTKMENEDVLGAIKKSLQIVID